MARRTGALTWLTLRTAGTAPARTARASRRRAMAAAAAGESGTPTRPAGNATGALTARSTLTGSACTSRPGFSAEPSSTPPPGRSPCASTPAHGLESQTFDESTRENTERRLRLHVYPELGDRTLGQR